MVKVRTLANAVVAYCALLTAPVHAQALPTLEDVLSLADIGERSAQLSVSSDGGHVAFVERSRRIEGNDYTHTLVTVATDTGLSQRIADAGDIILADNDGRESGGALLRTALWSPDNAWIAYLVQRHGQTELWRVPASGGAAQRIAEGPGDVRRFAWKPEGDGLVFETLTPRLDLQMARDRAQLEGFNVDDRLEPRYALSPMPDLAVGRRVWVFAGSDIRAANEAEQHLLSTRVSSAAPAPLGEARANIGRNGESVWIAPVDPDTSAYRPPLTLFARSRESGAISTCDIPECVGAVTDAWVLSDGRILFLKTEGFARSLRGLYLWSPRERRVARVRQAEEELLGCALAREELLCLQEGTLQPRRLVRIDLTTGRAHVLYDPNSHWATFRQPRVERIDVHDYRGEQSFGRLFAPTDPDARDPSPLVIVQYRARGFLTGGTGGEYPIHAFLARGYYVLAIERPDHEALWARHDLFSALRITELEQVEHRAKLSAIDALLNVLRRRGDIDMTRIAITGLSDGAETAYWALSHSNHFAVAATSTPPVDQIGWSLGSARHRNAMRAGLGASGDWDDAPRQWRRFWRTVSPARNARRIDAPILMQLSASEALQAFPFFERMRSLGRTIEFYIYPEARHLKWRPRQLLITQRRNVDWIDFWLRGIGEDDPDEPDRGDRWRSYRATTSNRAR